MFVYPINHNGGTTPRLEYTDGTHSASSLTTYTFSNRDVGDASTDRLVVVCISGFRDAGGTVSSATIGGVSATIHLNQSSAYSSGAIISATVPTGTTATVAITWSILQAGCAISVYTVKGHTSTTPEFTEQDSGTTLSKNITFPTNTAVIAGVTRYVNNAITWSGSAGLTEDRDVQFGSGRPRHSSASRLFNSPGTSLNVTASPGSSTSVLNIIGFS